MEQNHECITASIERSEFASAWADGLASLMSALHGQLGRQSIAKCRLMRV